MSLKNKTFDRDAKGKICRIYTGPSYHVTWDHPPSWWVNLTMNRPRRREVAQLCRRVLRGTDPDELIWPLGNSKPHEYWT